MSKNESDRRGELIVRELFGWQRFKDSSGRSILAPNRAAAERVRKPMSETVLVDERVSSLWKESVPEWRRKKD